VSQAVVVVNCYVLRRRRLRRAARGLAEEKQYEYVYEMWVVSEAVSVTAATAVADSGDTTVGALMDRLTKSVADVAAGRVEGLIWKSADLPGQQALNLVADLPDIVRELAAKQLGGAPEAAGVAAPVAVFGSQVAAAFGLEPVLGPVEDFLHGLELVGVLIGVVTGQMHLAVLCTEHWLHDEVSSAVPAVVERLVKGPGDETPRARRLKTVSGNSYSPSEMMTGGGGITLSPEGREQLAEARKVVESTRHPVAATKRASEPASRVTGLTGGMSSL
jgi:hypothetical protein